jgi:DTW domain-containing protein YfiP
MLEGPEFLARAICQRCSRPSSVCLCRDLIEIDTCTPIVILQHPRESSVPIGTARLAELAFKSAERHVGVRFSECRPVRDALSDAQAPPILLFPGDGARDLAQEPPLGPVTLVVIDGTWSQAGKILKQNPELSRLPRYALDPQTPSRYRIRREPARHCMSTIEAIVGALRVLERAERNVQAALLPFDLLVEQQLSFARVRRAHRHVSRKRAPRKALPPPALRERSRDLVVVYGEANAWPRGTPLGAESEIVHWAAERVLSGERFEAFIAPRRALSPSFTHHTGVPEARVMGGEAWSSFCERWAAFCTPNDIVCTWGHFALERLRAEDATIPERLDVRPIAVRCLRQKPGDVLSCAAAFGEEPGPQWARGRTGLRLSGLLSVVRALLARC